MPVVSPPLVDPAEPPPWAGPTPPDGPGRGGISHVIPGLRVVDFSRVAGGATGGTASRLASMRSAGLVRRASERVDEGIERTLPVAAGLRPLLPRGDPGRGGSGGA